MAIIMNRPLDLCNTPVGQTDPGRSVLESILIAIAGIYHYHAQP
jgi:hypothetical protein